MTYLTPVLLYALALAAGLAFCLGVYRTMVDRDASRPARTEQIQALRRIIACRARYWWRRVCHALGFCPACGDRVNRTRSGAALCPSCGAR